MNKKKVDYNSIPKEVELFGRIVKTVDDSKNLNYRGNFGEAQYGNNCIMLTKNIGNKEVAQDEIKLTYLHEMLHFILNFTGYQEIIRDSGKIDLEQFIELMASAIYQYEKSAKY